MRSRRRGGVPVAAMLVTAGLVPAVLVPAVLVMAPGLAVAQVPPASAAVSPEPAAVSPEPEGQAVADDEPVEAWHRYHIETGLFPVTTVQMIEGPNRDDTVTSDTIVSTALGFSYAPLRWLEPGLWLQFDAGSVDRALFTPSDEQGQATELSRVEGSFWELWTVFMLRGRLDWAFAELGWAPLIVRRDTLRTDLENTAGEADGLFQGSRSVAWLAAFGVSVPITEHIDATGRMQFRIRYLVSRDGADLAHDEENGQMALYPFLGAHAHF